MLAISGIAILGVISITLLRIAYHEYRDFRKRPY